MGSQATANSATSGLSGIDNTHAAPIYAAPYATIAICSHVLVVLKLQRPNFNKWEPFFKSLLGKFGHRGHVNVTVAANPTDSTWAVDDACVHSWLLGSIAADVQDLAMAPNKTAHQPWQVVEGLYLANKEPHAIFLHEEFSCMKQGDLSINGYCQGLKTVADAQRDVSHAVSPSQLVLSLLHGLNPCFSSTAGNIANTTPLPDFNTAREKLVLKELSLVNDGKVSSETALHAAGSPSYGTTCRSISGCFGAA